MKVSFASEGLNIDIPIPTGNVSPAYIFNFTNGDEVVKTLFVRINSSGEIQIDEKGTDKSLKI